MSTHITPIANGLRTDHPFPQIPFVDDSHIPLDEPQAIEDIGRHEDQGTWGRYDNDDTTGEWIAYTTDPYDHRYGWIVQHHPQHGRSVLLYMEKDTGFVHTDWLVERPLVVRAGGYWWDGETWFRPRQILDYAQERFAQRHASRAVTVTAADLLDDNCNTNIGAVHKVLQLDATTEVTREQWRHDLALWYSHRSSRHDALPTEQCVVTLSAPELADQQLLSVDELAKAAEIAPSTLRAYMSRDEGDIPAPQIASPRKGWSRPVVQDWLEAQRREPTELAKALNGDDTTASPGLKDLSNRLSETLFNLLWSQQARRKWSRAHRNEESVRSTANHLGWVAASHIESTIPTGAVADMLEHAVLWEFSSNRKPIGGKYHFMPNTGKMLGWFVRHNPSRAPHLFGSIIRQAEHSLNISRDVAAKSLRSALLVDGGFAKNEVPREFFDLVLPPTSSEQ